MSLRRPVIGITPDRDFEATDIEALYQVRRNYCDAVIRAGGIPIILPYMELGLVELFDLLDGLIVTGGMFDIDPVMYDGLEMPSATLKRDRTSFEIAILKLALEKNLPVLGICGGMQLIGVTLGAKVYQDLPTDNSDGLEHMQLEPCSKPHHPVEVEPDSLLFSAVQSPSMLVNSLHHQALKDVIPPLRVVARAQDGTVEAVESLAHTFCLGTQWHPEYAGDEKEGEIFKAFVQAARG